MGQHIVVNKRGQNAVISRTPPPFRGANFSRQHTLRFHAQRDTPFSKQSTRVKRAQNVSRKYHTSFVVLLRESRRRARGIYKIFKFEGYREREKFRERAQRETEDHANASPPRPRARKTLNYFSREKTQKESVFVRRRDRERERERTMGTLCVICVKLSENLRHETLQFFSLETSKTPPQKQ